MGGGELSHFCVEATVPVRFASGIGDSPLYLASEVQSGRKGSGLKNERQC